MKTRNVLAGMISADNFNIMQNTMEWLVANMAGNETPYVSTEDVYYLINQPIGCSTKQFRLDEHYIWKEFFTRLMSQIEFPVETTRAIGFFCITETTQKSASLTAKERLKTLLEWAVNDITNHYENMTKVEQTNELFDLLNRHLAYFLIDKKFDTNKSLPTDLWTNFACYTRFLELPVSLSEVIPYIEMLLQLAEVHRSLWTESTILPCGIWLKGWHRMIPTYSNMLLTITCRIMANIWSKRLPPIVTIT